MIGYVDIEEQVDADFTRALRRAFFYRLGARLRGDPSSFLAPSFEEAARTSGARNKLRLGRRVVAVDKIVGAKRMWTAALATNRLGPILEFAGVAASREPL